MVGILHIQQEENLFYMEVVELFCTSLLPFVLLVLFLLGGYVFHPFLSIADIYVFVSSQEFSHEFQTFPLSISTQVSHRCLKVAMTRIKLFIFSFSPPPWPAPFSLTVPSLSSLCLNSNQNPSVHSHFPPYIFPTSLSYCSFFPQSSLPISCFLST